MARTARKRPTPAPVADDTANTTDAPALVSLPPSDCTVDQGALKAAAARIASIVDKASTIPILANVALRSRGDHVEMVATDLSVYLTLRLATGKGCSRFGTTVSAHKLSTLVRTLPAGDVALATEERFARISAGRVKARLECLPDRDFPKIPSLGDLPCAQADAQTLRDAIDAVLFSVCKDETRFHLAGALLECDGTTLTMVSTDGHRLTRVRRPLAWSGASLASGVLLPVKGLQELKKVLAGEQSCQIGIAKPYFFVRAGNAEIAIKITDAQFPPYEQVIPKDYTALVTVATTPLREALERAKLLTCDTRGARLEIADGVFTVASESPDVGDVVETIDTDYHGKAIRWGCNPVYLLQLLAEMNDPDSITMGFDPSVNGGLSPVLVRSTDDAAMRPLSEATMVGVIMPMRI